MIDMMSSKTRADRTLFDNGDDAIHASEASIVHLSNTNEPQSRAESFALSAKVSRLMNSLKGATDALTEESEPNDGSNPVEEE